jgi:putative hydrolase of the HAD superfamily
MKAILFDAGNTLVWVDHPYLVQLLADHGVQTTEEALMGAEYEAKLVLDEMVRGGKGGDDRSRGKIYFAEVFRRIGLPDEQFPAVAERMWARHAERNLWSLVRDHTIRTLEELRGLGYRLAVISNADGRVEALLDSLDLRPHFEFVIDSTLVGVEKPDPRIFRMALERLGVEPHEAAYVGDIYEIDVVGSRNAGLHPYLVDPLGRSAGRDCDTIRGIDELPGLLGRAG